MENFSFRLDSNKHRNECKNCESQIRKTYRQNNNEKVKIARQNYYKNNIIIQYLS